MTDAPWLSVLMPTYNGEAFLAPCLDSLVDQDSASIECIVVDDASTDRTLEILGEYRDRLPFTVIRHTSQGNWIKSTNEALRTARGEYVCFLHQDDVWLPGRLETLRESSSRAPNASLLLGSAIFLDTRGRALGRWRCPLPASRREIDKQQLLQRLLVQNFIPMPAPAIRRDLALAVAGLDEDLWYTADWDFWLKVAPLAVTLYDDKPCVGFRVHPRSQTFLGSADPADMRAQLTAVSDRYIENWNGPAPQKDRLHRVAKFSTDMNVALARAAHGQAMDVLRLARAFLALGPAGQYQYLRDSRVIERSAARIRAGLG